MALSYGQYFGTGSQTNFDAPFEYLSKSHVKVRVDGELVPFTWFSTYTVTITPPPAFDSVVEVRRETPRNERLVAFTDGSTLVETDLNTSTLQSFFLAQEAFDQGAASLAVTEDGQYSAGLRRITNVQDPVNGKDVVTKDWALSSINSNVGLAVSAKDAAISAKNASEAARDTANTFRTNASTSASAADAAKVTAVAAKDTAVAAQTDITTKQADVASKWQEVSDWRALLLGYRNETQGARDAGVAAKDTAVAAKDTVVGYTSDLYRSTILSSPVKPSPILADKVGILNSEGSNATVQITLNQLRTLVLSGVTFVPTGAIAAFLDGSIPDDWLPLEGQAVSRTGATAALFAKWGTKYGAGDGSTTFNVPDTRGEFLRGWANGRSVDNGRSLGTFQGQDVQPHNHPATFTGNQLPDHQHPVTAQYMGGYDGPAHPTWGNGDFWNGWETVWSGGSNVALVPSGSVTVQNSTGSETRPRNFSVRWCVKL